MKKRTIIAAVLILIIGVIAVTAGCNRQLLDTTWKFDRAIICLPNGEIVEGKVDSWKDFDDGDQLQIKIEGVTYLVHANNVALIAD